MQDRLLALLIEASQQRQTTMFDDDDDKPAYDESKPERKYDDSIDKTYERVKNLLSPVGKAARAVGRGVRRVAQSKKARAVARGVGKLGLVPTEGQYKRRALKKAANVLTQIGVGKQPFNTKRPTKKKKQQQDDES